MRCRSPRARRERGAAAVEFALIAPLLLLILFGIISYGYMLSYRQGISQAAAEGARKAAVALPTTPSGTKITSAVSAVNEALGSYGVSCTATAAATAVSATGNLVKGATRLGSCSVVIGPCPSNATQKCASVTINHQYADHPLLPSVPGLGIVLPKSLAYTAVAEVN